MKIFNKKIKKNGRTHVYFLGIKVFSYRIKRGDLPFFWAKEARDSGVKIGNNVRSVARQNWGSEPWLIEVGDDTLMSFDVTFLTHDGSISACAPYFKDNSKVSKFGKIKIGKGCFIGCKTTIMPGVTIGNHCVTAACSVITKDIPDGEVWGGVPAKFICTTEELAKKTEQNSQTEEQRELRDYVNKMREKK